MSFSLSCARATIKKLKVDKKTEDDGTKTAIAALSIEARAPADILAEFHPSLRAAWFVKDGGIRFRPMKEVGWEGTRRGVDLAIRPGPDMKPALTLLDVTLRDFKLKPIEESGQQQVFLRFVVDLNEGTAAPVSRLVEYLKEESWIDIDGGGELDLAPPSARAEIEGLDGGLDSNPAPVEELAPTVERVRRLQPTKKGAKEKLSTYPDAVLEAAIATESRSPDARPMFMAMLQGELKRRQEDQQ